jgi:NlpE N-terminal domain
MKRLYIALEIIAALCLVFCSDAGNNGPKAVDTVKQEPAAVNPTGPPARVNGTFKGILPCDNCRETEAILTIKDDGYNYTRLFKGMKTKGENINNKSGYCVFDSGIIKLLNNNIAEYMFRIVSVDTIKPLDAGGKPFKGKTGYFLIRSAKQTAL